MKKVSTILIIIGIIIIAVPIIGSVYSDQQQKKIYEDYLNSLAVSELDLIQEAEEAEELDEPVIDTYQPTVLGRIKIPCIEVNMLLVEGATAKDLKLGAGHLPETPMPGEIGNSAISGHRNYTFGSFFNRLGDVAVGHQVVVEYGDTTLTYEVEEILTVLPDDVSVLNQPRDRSMLTLITCTPVRKATHRLILHCKLIS